MITNIIPAIMPVDFEDITTQAGVVLHQVQTVPSLHADKHSFRPTCRVYLPRALWNRMWGKLFEDFSIRHESEISGLDPFSSNPSNVWVIVIS